MRQQEEELILKKRFMDLSHMADRKNMVTFSNFLNLNEINLFFQTVPELATAYRLSGGYEFAERQMVAFIPDALYYEWNFPISCLKFVPANLKFAEELTHRDVLGALMSLGIERSRIGDIRPDGREYYVFCEEEFADYLLTSLNSIRHTTIKGEKVDAGMFHVKQKFEDFAGVVASLRLDNIVAFVTGLSRTKSVLLIQGQKVFVNQKMILSNSYECRENDVISIRGHGKFIYRGCSGGTRKGRIKITVGKYL